MPNKGKLQHFCHMFTRRLSSLRRITTVVDIGLSVIQRNANAVFHGRHVVLAFGVCTHEQSVKQLPNK